MSDEQPTALEIYNSYIKNVSELVDQTYEVAKTKAKIEFLDEKYIPSYLHLSMENELLACQDIINNVYYLLMNYGDIMYTGYTDLEILRNYIKHQGVLKPKNDGRWVKITPS